MTDEIDAARRLLTSAGYECIPPDGHLDHAPAYRPYDRDLSLADDWNAMLMSLRIACDRVHAGARLKVRRLYPGDPVELLRVGVIRQLDVLLASAVVEDGK